MVETCYARWSYGPCFPTTASSPGEVTERNARHDSVACSVNPTPCPMIQALCMCVQRKLRPSRALCKQQTMGDPRRDGRARLMAIRIIHPAIETIVIQQNNHSSHDHAEEEQWSGVRILLELMTRVFKRSRVTIIKKNAAS